MADFIKSTLPELANETIFNAKIIFKNFKGEETAYNKKGDRNCVIVFKEEQRELAEEMLAKGWPVKRKEGYNDPDAVEYHVKAKLKTDLPANLKPKCFWVNGEDKQRTEIPPENYDELDKTWFGRVDMTIRAFAYARQIGKNVDEGYSVQIFRMYVTPVEGQETDPLDAQYE